MNSGEDWTEETLRACEEVIGYSFRDKTLLKTCFTHESYTNQLHGEKNNERLEFLGDAVLGLCISEKIFLGDSDKDEGKLTDIRKEYVSEEPLTVSANKLNLMRFLRYSGGSDNIGGKTASNLFEAVVAGIYLDGGLEEAKKFVKKFAVRVKRKDYKTMLQKYVQERTKKTPEYSVTEQNGKSICRVSALGCEARGEGDCPKAAKKDAAKNLYTILTENK